MQQENQILCRGGGKALKDTEILITYLKASPCVDGHHSPLLHHLPFHCPRLPPLLPSITPQQAGWKYTSGQVTKTNTQPEEIPSLSGSFFTASVVGTPRTSSHKLGKRSTWGDWVSPLGRKLSKKPRKAFMTTTTTTLRHPKKLV